MVVADNSNSLTMSTRDSPLSERSRSSSSPKALSTGTIKAVSSSIVKGGAIGIVFRLTIVRCSKGGGRGPLLALWKRLRRIAASCLEVTSCCACAHLRQEYQSFDATTLCIL